VHFQVLLIELFSLAVTADCYERI